jgi:hypothetical protein
MTEKPLSSKEDAISTYFSMTRLLHPEQVAYDEAVMSVYRELFCTGLSDDSYLLDWAREHEDDSIVIRQYVVAREETRVFGRA